MTPNEVRVLAEAASFPETFGLAAWPGDDNLFRVEVDDSFVNDRGDVVLYVYAWASVTARWVPFAKDTADGLRREIVETELGRYV